MKVVVCDPIHPAGFEILKNAKDIELVDASRTPKDELLKVIEDADGVITRSPTPVDEKFLSHAKKLKAVVRAGVGVDNVDMEAASKKGVIIMNVPTANTLAAVELTMAHLLTAARSFTNAVWNLKKEHEWNREKWLGIELAGKKLGIIGFGNIGSRVGIRAKALEMDVIAYDPYIDPSKATDLGCKYTTDFEEILKCDFITIHTPKTKETINMITKKEIEKMKDGVVLINCARGGLYNEEDVAEALKSGKIAWLGIDVFNKEPLTEHPFFELENTSVTPHIGANTKESQERIAIQAAEGIIEALRGSSYPNALNLPINTANTPEWVIKYLELSQKMGYILSQVINKSIKKVKVNLSGDISKEDKSVLTFTLVGLLQNITENVNYVNAEFLATEKGIVTETKEIKNDTYKNLVNIKVITDDGEYSISGTMLEEHPRIVEFKDFDLEFEPKGKMIFFKNTDVPGVIGEVGMTLAKNNINIADFRLGRNKEGQAMAVIIVDNEVNEDVLNELRNLKAALSVGYAEI
ncbi:D-3-phosphoglycerate dehydrogenase [Nautilia profundicola AmH]|uniref:D-3-phosphoglycerate dehydrogenase n=1 Tax=Nautilia profundicola (strain ATCC BAA-1463 / DSM 18972 / AmH) TaxID=598659 RepID=B9L9K8_NAUPA|nr:phosphoglycerate dehydrogenase [Nautilia profundicola]ACM92635.1 D-3-phosphoglycerate dehydrogenase [Nautilia profundicola AmH]